MVHFSSYVFFVYFKTFTKTDVYITVDAFIILTLERGRSKKRKNASIINIILVQVNNFQKVPFLSKNLTGFSTWQYCYVKNLLIFLTKRTFWKLLTCIFQSKTHLNKNVHDLSEIKSILAAHTVQKRNERHTSCTIKDNFTRKKNLSEIKDPLL